MRARGAQVTDIVIIVIAATEGIMPQTVEAIEHAKAAGVSIVVAVNKCDLPGANPQAARQRLMEHGLIPEEFGGDIICVDISAKQKTGLDKLLEMVNLQAELLELKADVESACGGRRTGIAARQGARPGCDRSRPAGNVEAGRYPRDRGLHGTGSGGRGRKRQTGQSRRAPRRPFG